jgi:hypothetical protein
MRGSPVRVWDEEVPVQYPFYARCIQGKNAPTDDGLARFYPTTIVVSKAPIKDRAIAQKYS